MSMKIILNENKTAIWITLAILIIGSIAYFNADVPKSISKMSEIPKDTMDAITKNDIDSAIYDNMEFKVVYAEGIMKIFANADSSYLTELKTDEGNNVPGKFSMIIGYEEANMMKEEGLFSKIGDKFDNLFGLSITVGGILKETKTPIDNFHFISEKQYEKLVGDENIFFIKTTPDGMAKLFYQYDSNNSNLDLKLEEGDMKNFKVHEMLGKKYYPIIIGSEEAKVMKEEKLFNEPGDIIKNLFGNNFVVIGVLEPTASIIDKTHFVTLEAGDLQ